MESMADCSDNLTSLTSDEDQADGRILHLGEFDHEHESLLGVGPEQLLPQVADRLDTSHQVHSRGTVFDGHGAGLQGLELRGEFKANHDITSCGGNQLGVKL